MFTMSLRADLPRLPAYIFTQVILSISFARTIMPDTQIAQKPGPKKFARNRHNPLFNHIFLFHLDRLVSHVFVVFSMRAAFYPLYWVDAKSKSSYIACFFASHYHNASYETLEKAGKPFLPSPRKHDFRRR
jgi:hypothetical protein